MRPKIPQDRVMGRAEPLPEERARQTGEEDRRRAAAEILGDSEERVAEAAQADAPGDAAAERRRSEETLDS